jgi:hypothetical protein
MDFLKNGRSETIHYTDDHESLVTKSVSEGMGNGNDNRDSILGSSVQIFLITASKLALGSVLCSG